MKPSFFCLIIISSPINSLLEQAACIVRRSKIAAGTLEPTESYKRGQIEELKSFADSLDLWIDLSNLEITYMDKGGENEVFHDGNTSVIKLNNFEYAGDDLENFFIRIFAHNRFFNNVPYSLSDSHNIIGVRKNATMSCHSSFRWMT